MNDEAKTPTIDPRLQPAIRLLVREALTLSRRIFAAVDGLDDGPEEPPAAPAVGGEQASRLDAVAGLLVMSLLAQRGDDRAEEAGYGLSFPPFALDVVNETLLRDGVEVAVQAKQFCILRYLAEHPQRLVKHEELKEAVWGSNVISESLLRTHVRALRRALGDGVLETVVGRGYRFLPTVTRVYPASDRHDASDDHALAPVLRGWPRTLRAV
jgi:DNA-binding winged helix-turn-helix (wHTH) protein